jgi:hypothetical protein
VLETPNTRLFSAGYTRAFTKAVIAAVLFWHVAGAVPALVAHLKTYHSATVEVCAWLVLFGVITIGARLLLRGVTTVRMVWLLVAVTLAAGAAATLACPRTDWLRADWSWGAVGWVLVLLLLNRPLGELIGVLLIEAGLTFAVLVVNEGLNRQVIAAFLTVLYASASIQIMLAVAARTMNFTAQVAAEIANSQDKRATRDAVAEELATARTDRYQAARLSIVPLLRSLADGTLNVSDPAVQTRCAFEATTLRRLAAEGDERPNPLIHELEACVDVAYRRGAAVELAVSGSPPALDTQTRRDLAEPVIALLSTTREYARIAVATDPDTVRVSVLTDSAEPISAPSDTAGMSITTGQDDDLQWVEVRWHIP